MIRTLSRVAWVLVVIMLALACQSCGLTARMWERQWAEERTDHRAAAVTEAAVSSRHPLRLLLHLQDHDDEPSRKIMELRPLSLLVHLPEEDYHIKNILLREMVDERRGKKQAAWPWRGQMEVVGTVPREAVSRLLSPDELALRPLDRHTHRRWAEYLQGQDWARLAGQPGANDYVLVGGQPDSQHSRRTLPVVADLDQGTYYQIGWAAARTAPQLTYWDAIDGSLHWQHSGTWLGRTTDTALQGGSTSPLPLTTSMDEVRLHTRWLRPQGHGLSGISWRIAATPFTHIIDSAAEPAIMYAVLIAMPLWLPQAIMDDYRYLYARWNPETMRWE